MSPWLAPCPITSCRRRFPAFLCVARALPIACSAPLQSPAFSSATEVSIEFCAITPSWGCPHARGEGLAGDPFRRYRSLRSSRWYVPVFGVAAKILMQQANWIPVQSGPSASSPEVGAAGLGLGTGERSIIISIRSDRGPGLDQGGPARRPARGLSLSGRGFNRRSGTGATLGRADDLRTRLAGSWPWKTGLKKLKF